MDRPDTTERDQRAEAEFRALCRASMARSLKDRVRYGFIAVPARKRPCEVRAWDSMAEYRKHMAKTMPPWMGYGP
jgi:hypothetical protein